MALKKRITSFLLCVFLVVFSVFPAFAATDDFQYMGSEITYHMDGYDSAVGYYYGTTFYTLYFNEADILADTYNSSYSSYFTLAFDSVTPHKTHSGSVEGIMHLLYGGVSDTSSLIVKDIADSGEHTTSGASVIRFKKTGIFFTDSTVLSSFLTEKGYDVRETWYVFFDDALGYDYTVYTISTTESGEVICSFSKLGTTVTYTDGVLKVSSSSLYSVVFDTLEHAEEYMRSGSTSGIVRCETTKSISGVTQIHYSNYNVLDSSNNLIFAAFPIGSVEGEDIGNNGLLSGIVGAINNLGSQIFEFFDDLIDILTFPVEMWLGYYEDIVLHFNFIENVFVFIDLFGDFCERDFSDPVVITMNMDNYEGVYDFGDEMIILDLGWYTKEWSSGLCLKDIGDFVISSFLWLTFLWNLYCVIPDILSGSGMTLRQQYEVRMDHIARRQQRLPRLGGSIKRRY